MATWKKVLTEEDGNLATVDLTANASRTYTLGANSTLKFASDNGTELIKLTSGPVGAQFDQIDFTAPEINLRHSVGTSSPALKFFESGDDAGDHYVGLKSPTSLSASYTLKLPTADGTNGQALVTDGSGNLSFSTISGSGTIDGSGSTNKLAYWSDSDTLTSNQLFGVTPSTGVLAVGGISCTNFGGASGAGIFESTASNHDIIGVSTTQTVGSTSTGARFFSKFGTGTVSAGRVYSPTGASNAWVASANDDLAESSSILAVADDTASSQLMLKEGAVKMASNQGFSSAAVGAPLYLSSQAGHVTSTVPSAGQNPVYVRIVGYVIDASNSIIYFDPDKSWVEI